MTAHLTTLSGQLSRELAAMRTVSVDDCREQDLAACDAIETIIAPCEGNGDAYGLFMDAINMVREQVRKDREQAAINERQREQVRRRVLAGMAA